MYRFEQDEGRRTKFTTARLNLASQVQYHHQLLHCTGTSTMIYRYSVPTVPIYFQALCGRYAMQEGLADGERPQTDPWVWQVVEYSAAEAVLGIDFPFRNELETMGTVSKTGQQVLQNRLFLFKKNDSKNKKLYC